MKRYIALCICALVGISGILMISAEPIEKPLKEWEQQLQLPKTYEIIETHKLPRRQQLAIVKVLEPDGYRHVMVLGQNRLTHWKLVESLDLGVATKDSIGQSIEEAYLTAGYIHASDSPPSPDCIEVAAPNSTYSLWIQLQGSGHYSQHK